MSARKAGVLCATGEYCSSVDSDDWVDTDMYERLVRKMDGNRPDVVVFGYKKEYGDWTETRKEYLAPGIYQREQLEDIVKAYLKQDKYFYMPIVIQSLASKLIRTEILQKSQMEIDDRIRMGEDCVSYACILASKTIQVVEEYPYHYAVRATSIGHKLDMDAYDRCKKLISYLNKIVKPEPCLYKLLIQCIYYHLLMVDAGKVLQIKHGSFILFPELKKHDRVILYGKGVLGTSIHKAMEESGFCEIVDWVDSASKERLLQRKEAEYDHIVIAISIYELVLRIEKELIEGGISQDKMVHIRPDDLLEENLPEDVQSILAEDSRLEKK